MVSSRFNFQKKNIGSFLTLRQSAIGLFLQTWYRIFVAKAYIYFTRSLNMVPTVENFSCLSENCYSLSQLLFLTDDAAFSNFPRPLVRVSCSDLVCFAP